MADESRRRRWPWALVAVAALLMLGTVGWRHFFGPLSAEELALIGEWEGRYDDPPGQQFAVLVYRPDRTFSYRFPDFKTGAFTRETPAARWRLSGGRLVTHHGGAAEWFDDLINRRSRTRVTVLDLTPDGPDRYRYTAVNSNIPPTTGTFTRRSTAPGDSP